MKTMKVAKNDQKEAINNDDEINSPIVNFNKCAEKEREKRERKLLWRNFEEVPDLGLKGL